MMKGFPGWPHGGPEEVVAPTIEHSIDIPPTSPDAMDDEFDADTMDSKWTLSAPSGTPTVTFSDGMCHFTPYTTSNFDVQAMWQLLPVSGDWEFTLALADHDGTAYTYGFAGMMGLSAGASGVSSAGILFGSALWSSGGVSIAAFNPWNAWGYTVMNPSGEPQHKYLRIAKVGSNYTFYTSRTGITFVSTYTNTLGFTPERILIGSKTEHASATNTCNFKWFRKTA